MANGSLEHAHEQADIRDLYTRYTYNGDRGRLNDLAACFASDGTLEYPGGKGTGPAGIFAALSSGSGNPVRTFTRHHVTNPLIDLTDDCLTATGRAYFSVYCDNGLDHVGTYNDRFCRTAQGWRFASRQVRIDWQSPTSLMPPMTTR